MCATSLEPPADAPDAKPPPVSPADAKPPPGCCTKYVVAASVAFFLRFAALGAVMPYIFLWLEDNGFDVQTRGLVGALSSLASFVAPLVFGAIADATGRHLLILALTTLANAAAMAALTLWPQTLWWQLLCLVVTGACETGLIDAIIIRTLAWSGMASAAPRTRAFGALSWVTLAPFYGWFAREYGIAWLFKLYAPLTLASLPICLVLPVRQAYAAGGPPPTPSSEASGAAPPPLGRRIRAVLRRAELRAVLVLMAFIGLQFGIAFSLGFVYFEEVLHASGVMLGLALTAQAVVEVPLFQVAPRVVRWLGVRTALDLCVAGGAIRFAGYYFAGAFADALGADGAYVVLPFEVFHGMSFPISYTVIAVVAEEYASVGLQATVVGAANSAMKAGDAMMAKLLWPLVVNAVGLRASFAVGAAVAAAASAPLWLRLACRLRPRRNARTRLVDEVEVAAVDVEAVAAPSSGRKV